MEELQFGSRGSKIDIQKSVLRISQPDLAKVITPTDQPRELAASDLARLPTLVEQPSELAEPDEHSDEEHQRQIEEQNKAVNRKNEDIPDQTWQCGWCSETMQKEDLGGFGKKHTEMTQEEEKDNNNGDTIGELHCPAGSKCNNHDCVYAHPDGHNDVFWTAYAIKYWLEAWSTQRPMVGWTIDNYDAKDSYDELRLDLTMQHWREPRLQPNTFHRMRNELITLEGRMDEILDAQNMTGEEKSREWHELKDLALDICRGYGSGKRDASHSDKVHAQETMKHGEVNCMVKTLKHTTRDEEDEDDESDEGRLVCTMSGKGWEPLPFPMIVDSRASSSILLKDWCNHFKTWQTTESSEGQAFTAANGDEIPNLGRKHITLMTKEGTIRDMGFEV